MKINKMKVAVSSLYASAIATNLNVAFALGLPSELNPVITNIFTAVQIVGVIVAVAMITWAGFKFLTAGAGEKAKAKDQLVPIVIGAILIAFAGTIGKWIWNGVLNKGVSAPSFG